MEEAYRFWKGFQDKVLAPITALLLLGPIVLAMIEVIRRYIFGVSWDWQQDMVTYLILGGSYFFFSITQRQNAHLKVSLFSGLLMRKSPTLAHLITLLVQLVSALYLGYFALYGIKMTQNSYVSGRLVYSQIMPFWPFFLILTVGMVFLLITFLFQIYREGMSMAGKKVLEEEPESLH